MLGHASTALGRVGRFLRLSIGDEARLCTAAALLVVVRVAIVVVPFAAFRRVLLAPATVAARVVPGSPRPKRVAWAVDVADHYVPGERTCLMRSLTSETIHRLYGHEIVHRIGVDRTDDGVKAHSWIEYDDEVILGDLEDFDRYEPLPPLNEGGSAP